VDELEATEIRPPSLRDRQRAERELLILAEAERLLREEGYEGLVMERLADSVGVSKGTLYQHFAKKEDLVGAILLRSTARVNEQLTLLSADGARLVVERLGAVLALLIEGDVAWMSTITHPQKHELAAALENLPGLRDGFTRFFNGLCSLILQGQTTGELDATIPAPIAARFLVSLARAQSGPALGGQVTVSGQEFVAMAVRFYFHGLRAQPTT
jgi:TetR/AcrR family transcriptional regulator, fatty acid metabolism regulator protein